MILSPPSGAEAAVDDVRVLCDCIRASLPAERYQSKSFMLALPSEIDLRLELDEGSAMVIGEGNRAGLCV